MMDDYADRRKTLFMALETLGNVGSDSPQSRPDCVVIDANIWRSELLLKTPIGLSFTYTLGRQGGSIGLPEIVERELPGLIVQAGLEATQKVSNGCRTVNTLADSPFLPPLPSGIEFRNKLEARIAELKPILVRVPFTLEHAKAALDMVFSKSPPNRPKDQQFKDSAIWQAVLTLSREYSCHLVTNDHAFLRDPHDPSSGLAPNLMADCRTLGVDVPLHSDLPSCLEAIRGDVPSYNPDFLTPLIMESVMVQVRKEAARNYFEIGQVLRREIKAFRTRQIGRLAVDYTITMQALPDLQMVAGGRTECRAIAHGSCCYDVKSNSLSAGFLEYVTFEWGHPGGGYGRITRDFGHEDRSIPFRRPINWAKLDGNGVADGDGDPEAP